MVKADPKRDYYADLDLPSTADTETIKKRFRELAKQFHPDRNPGREVDVVPRFQAVQAANEVLSDPNQRAKYDAERAKLSKPVTSSDPPIFKRPPPPQPPPPKAQAGYNPQNSVPPSARRDGSAKGAYRTAGSTRPNQTASNSADRFTTFARSAPQPQSWDRQRFEESRAEALRGMNAMKGGQNAPPQPPRPSRHPTAPKPNGPMPDGPYSAGPGPPPGFPGLGRTPTSRKAFSPTATATDEPPAASAYAHHHRPPSTGPYQSQPPNPHIRHTKSSGFDGFDQVRPGLSRTSSRYAGHGGERTNINTTNLHRSASVRNSPIDSRYEEKGPFGTSKAPQGQQNDSRPRHRSLSPKVRPEGGVRFEFSASDTSSEGVSPSNTADRPKAMPKSTSRKQQAPFMANRTLSGDEPALTGQFPNTNYTRVVDDTSYSYPPPESKGMPARRPFSNMTSPVDHFASLHNDGTNANNSEEVPNADQRQYNGSGVSEDNQSPERMQSGFSASEWQERFKNGDSVFTPSDVNQKDRRSPTRGNRVNRQTGRNTGVSRSQEDLPNEADPVYGGTNYVTPEEARAKAAAFQEGRFSAENWADKLRSQNDVSGTNAKAPKRGSKSNGSKKPADATDNKQTPVDGEAADPSVQSHLEPDAMDVDEASGEGIPSKFTTNGATQDTYTTNGDSEPADSTNTGIDMKDLGRTAPFGPSGAGLRDMGDIGTSLPFESRAAKNLNLGRTHSQTLRDLNLPRPPRPVEPPADGQITQTSWKNYADGMSGYMENWNSFNSKMIEHFRQRQEQVTHNMYRNWVSAQGDGASADDFDRSHGHDKAGYATYMQWLEDDRMCRTWWDTAYEEHRKCLENLGRIRQRVKAMSG